MGGKVEVARFSSVATEVSVTDGAVDKVHIGASAFCCMDTLSI